MSLSYYTLTHLSEFLATEERKKHCETFWIYHIFWGTRISKLLPALYFIWAKKKKKYPCGSEHGRMFSHMFQWIISAPFVRNWQLSSLHWHSQIIPTLFFNSHCANESENKKGFGDVWLLSTYVMSHLQNECCRAEQISEELMLRLCDAHMCLPVTHHFITRSCWWVRVIY